MRFPHRLPAGNFILSFGTGNLFGDAVNIAARLQALVERGGICISVPCATTSGDGATCTRRDGRYRNNPEAFWCNPPATQNEPRSNRSQIKQLPMPSYQGISLVICLAHISMPTLVIANKRR